MTPPSGTTGSDVHFVWPSDAPEVPDWRPKFRTFHNYFRSWRVLLDEYYGASPRAPLSALLNHPNFSSLGRASDCPPQLIRSLRNAWSTEILLSLPVSLTDTPAIARYANAWSPVQAYYAVYSALVAVSYAESNPAKDHRAILNMASKMVSERRWVPDVYCYCCRGLDQLRNVTFLRAPACQLYPMSHLHVPRDASEALAIVMTCLKTTRRETIEQRVPELLRRMRTKDGRPRKALPRAERSRLEQNAPPTSLFDFLYRVRVRCNYRESESFIMGAWSDEDAFDFLDTIVAVVGHTLAFLETVIAGRLGLPRTQDLVREYLDRSTLETGKVPVAMRWDV